jgi:hypothetical protein
MMLFRIPRLAIRADNLALGLLLVLAVILFGKTLDLLWSVRGGVAVDAIDRFSINRDLKQPYTESPGDFGIFDVWMNHQRRCITGLLACSIPFKSLAAGTDIGRFLEAHSQAEPLAQLADVRDGFLWLVKNHGVFALVLGLGLLAIAGWGGGAICRVAALQLARQEMLTIRQAEHHARQRLWSGYVLAPMVPLGLAAFTALLMVLGGVLLRIPWVGDLLASVGFGLALLGGAVIAALLLGLAAAGHLFWPAVASEGTDGFDAFSRGFSYVFTKPWRTVLYGAVAVFLTALSWTVAHAFVFTALSVTSQVVGFGTAPFGWWLRNLQENISVVKMDLLWELDLPGKLYIAPNWALLGIGETVAAVLIGFWLLLTISALWGLLASLYFCSCTVCYFLLRRDVDGTDVSDLNLESDIGEIKSPAAAPSPNAPPPGSEQRSPES